MSCIIGYQDVDCAYVACDGFLGHGSWIIRPDNVKAAWEMGPRPLFIACCGSQRGYYVARSLLSQYVSPSLDVWKARDFAQGLRESFLGEGWEPEPGKGGQSPSWDFHALLTDGQSMFELDRDLTPIECPSLDFTGIGICTVAHGAVSALLSFGCAPPKALRRSVEIEARFSPNVTSPVRVYKIAEESVEEIR